MQRDSRPRLNVDNNIFTPMKMSFLLNLSVNIQYRAPRPDTSVYKKSAASEK